MRKRKATQTSATQTSAKLSEGSQEKAIVPKSKALVIISKLQDFTDVLEEIDPSLNEEFRTKYPSVLLNDKVAILDGDNNPLNKIYWGNCTSEIEIPDIILECFQMAENDKMNSIILQIRPHGAIEVMDLGQELILGLRIFAIENPFYGIRRLYYDTWFRQKTLKRKFRFQSEVTTSVKVFKERHVTVALHATYNEREYIHRLNASYPQRLGHKLKSVHVICAIDEWHTRRYFQIYQEHLKQSQYLPTQEKGVMHFLKRFTSGEVLVLGHHYCNTVRGIIATPKLNRQVMGMFFFKCMQEADDNGVSSVTFLVPQTIWSIRLLASILISCVKRFAKETPSSSIKRIYIRIDKLIAEFNNAKQIFEEEWSRTSGEESPDYLSHQIDEPLQEHQGKQGYPSEDIYLKKKMSISALPEKSKEGSKYASQEDVISEKKWARTSGGKQGYPYEDIYLKRKLDISELPEKSKEGSKYAFQEDVMSEKEWSRTSGVSEEYADYFSQEIDKLQEEHGGKQGYPSEDIYLKKKLSISELPEKSKEDSNYVSEGYVDWLPHESSK